MTKVEAIEQLIKENGGCVSLKTIYDKIEKFYHDAKKSNEWEAGLRGVLYRELKSPNSRFKKIGTSLYALSDYKEENKPEQKETVRMHSYIEGICVELGNEKKFATYTADPSGKFRDNVFLKDIVSMQNLPNFTYTDILQDVKRIDVLWFNNSKYAFPQYAFEVVDSINTLNGALNRCFQLQNFRTQFFIVAPENHKQKFLQTLDLQIYENCKDRFTFINYDKIIETYDILVGGSKKVDWIKQ